MLKASTILREMEGVFLLVVVFSELCEDVN